MPSFEFEVEYAKSARAACKQCKEKIEKGALRLGLKAVVELDADAGEAARKQAHAAEAVKWHHADCFPQIKGAAWFRKNLPESADACAGFASLEEADKERVRALLDACRGGAASNSTPSKTAGPGRKRKAGAEGEEGEPPAKQARAEPAGVLTEEQVQAFEAARAVVSKLGMAMLSTQLAKNGLPKSGRKEELVERVVECKVLGVPPACSACGKAKLKWSRTTGAFACPGFFDDEAKHFKRCKGPADGSEIVRTPWEELSI